jgi:hypothetical protein
MVDFSFFIDPSKRDFHPIVEIKSSQRSVCCRTYRNFFRDCSSPAGIWSVNKGDGAAAGALDVLSGLCQSSSGGINASRTQHTEQVLQLAFACLPDGELPIYYGSQASQAHRIEE